MSRCQPRSRLQVLSLDSGQAAAAAYLLLASPAKDTLNGPKTKRAARCSPRTHPGLSSVYFHSSRNPERQIAAGQESRQVKLGLTHDTPTICKGGSVFIGEMSLKLPRSRRRRADTSKRKSARQKKKV